MKEEKIDYKRREKNRFTDIIFPGPPNKKVNERL